MFPKEVKVQFVVAGSTPRLGGTPYNSLYERISLAEVYDRVEKPVEGLTGAFMAVKKSRKRFGFVIHLYLNGIHLQLLNEGI